MNTAIAIGTSIIFLLPGYIISKLLFPKDRYLWVHSIGILLSFILTGFGALILSAFDVIVSAITISIYNLVLTILLGPFILYKYSIRELLGVNTSEKHINIYFSVGIVLAFIIIVIILLPIAQSHNEQGYTEFSITEGFGDSAPWTNQYDIGESIILNYSVISHETSLKNFSVILQSNGQVLSRKKVEAVQPEQTSKGNIVIPPRISNPQKYELLLFDDDNQVQYRTLFFWIQSKEPIY